MMNNPHLASRARKAYGEAWVMGQNSHDIWLRSLDFIVQALDEAKIALEQRHYARVFDRHKRIGAVLMALQHHLPVFPTPQPDDPRYASAHYLSAFYAHIRRSLTGLSAKPNAPQRYDDLKRLVRGLREHLASLKVIP